MSQPKATGVWFGNSAWPSGRSPGAFAKDAFRLEGCETDRDKAMAWDKWQLRCMNRGPNCFTPGLGGYIKNLDPLTLFTSWGHNECTGWGWVATEALQAAGLKARRAVPNNSGHTFHEVWYKGLDGKEGWHAFDPFVGYFFLNDAGEVASCEELAANPDLVTRPRALPGARSRIGHHPERSGVFHRYQVHDNLDVIQPLRGEELSFEPLVGMRFTNLWKPEHPDLVIPCEGRPGGAHCSISLYDEEGKPRYSEHLPYWKNYMWPAARPNNVDSGISGQDPVRYHGCGHLRWKPLEYGEQVTCETHHAVFENGTVRPSGAKKHCEVWWKIKVPYLISYLRIGAAADQGGGDLIGFSVSPDKGKSFHTIHWSAKNLPKLLTLSPSDSPSLRGMREFWLRLDMSTQSSTSPLCIRGLQVTVGYQTNMHLQPRLVPGSNELYVEAGDMKGVKLETEWAYTHPEGEKTAKVELASGKKATQQVDPKLDRPDQAIMRGVTLRCLPADA